MGSAFHQLCPRYSGTLTPTAPTAIRLWDTFTFLHDLGLNNISSREFSYLLFSTKLFFSLVFRFWLGCIGYAFEPMVQR